MNSDGWGKGADEYFTRKRLNAYRDKEWNDRWHDARKELPEEKTYVLVYADNHCIIGWYGCYRGLSGIKTWNFYGGYNELENIIAWQELPDPPDFEEGK